MSRIFVKKNELNLINGGYLVTGKKETPVYNLEFIAAQRHAEWVVTFAEKAKGKDFIGKVPDTIEGVREEVKKALSDNEVKYIDTPKEVKQDLTEKLQKEKKLINSYNSLI